MNYFVYIITNYQRTVLYIGITNDLLKRMTQHKNEGVKGFSAKYHLTDLIYYEKFDHIVEAITREKQLKNWSRSKKENLINKHNPGWKDNSQSLSI